MDRTRRKLDSARKAVDTLFEVCDIVKPTAIERDAAIQRFEYSFETVWKAAQQVLSNEGFQANSPRMSARYSREAGLLDDESAEAALRMLSDRNLTSHTYQESLAEEIFERLATHARLLKKWLDALETRTDQAELS